MSLMEPAIWQSRWQALDNTIADALKPLQDRSEGWAITVRSTLECLRAFGEKQFRFFYDGFKESNLVDSPKYKAEYALRQTLDQIAYDLSVLQRAHSQRLPELSSRRERDTLELADLLAYRALKPAIEAGMLYETAVITYFQKATYVRIVPYAPVAMIGIPYTCTGIFDANGNFISDLKLEEVTHTARDFLAIAHEAGHHLFWHGQQGKLRARLRSKLPTEPAYRQGWLEEIFADVYGAVVAGPILALDFQELLFDNVNLMADDGRHPVDVLRPFIYTETLRQITRQGVANDVPQKLDELWQDLMNERDKRDYFMPNGSQPHLSVSLKDARTTVEETIKLILEEIEPALSIAQDGRWSADDNPPNSAAYETFKQAKLEPDDQYKTFEAVATLIGDEVEVEGNTLKWETGKPLVKWFQFLEGAKDIKLTLLPETWNTLLEGGGWAAGGPEGSTVPPG